MVGWCSVVIKSELIYTCQMLTMCSDDITVRMGKSVAGCYHLLHMSTPWHLFEDIAEITKLKETGSGMEGGRGRVKLDKAHCR